ncbi:gamma-glutamyltranspeptidase [Faecalibacterium longum]|uniref:gamma-glutamyltranspeptidase n=1 Tax=Faecalibacterium longum TaxID=1851428 RepID=UPI001D0E26A8|nr:gamma-glutamyltranspeptidase [Faecalibacterium longum]MCC2142144.1 gamma-glutamyltranspeptidase [Faecalibacterium longum CLA-AA-H243]
MKLFAAALALTLGLAGCGPVDGDPIRSGASAPDSVPRQDAVTVAQLRQQAEQNGSLAVVLYLGSVPERTTDVDAALDSLPEQPWQFVTDIPADRWVTAPGGGRELYCIFAVRREDTLFVYEKQDPAYPAQLGKELYGRQGGQPILLLCNGTPDTPDITAVVYCTTGRTLDWSPQFSAETDSPVPVEGVDVFSNHPTPGAAL